MPAADLTPFRRILGRKDLLRGDARSTFLWSLLSVFLLVILFLLLFLLAELCEHRGYIHVLAHDVDVVEQLMEGRSLKDSDVVRGAPPPLGIRFRNQGLLPSVWHSRNRVYGPVLSLIYRRTPALHSNLPAFVALLLSAAVIAIVRAMALARAVALSNRVGMDAATRLRTNIHRQRMRLGPGDLDERTIAAVLALFSQDVEHVRGSVAIWVRRVARCPAEVVALVGLALLIQWRLALLVMVPMALCLWLVRRENRKVDTSVEQARDRAAQELQQLSDNLGKTRLVRGYGMDQFEQSQFEKYLGRLRDSTNAIDHLGDRQKWMARLLVILCFTLLIYFTGTKTLMPVDHPQALTLSGAIALLSALGLILNPIDQLLAARRERAAAAQTAGRIHEYLNRIPEVGQAVGAKFLQPISKSLQFEAVSYTLPDKRKLLDRFDLKIAAGEIVGIVSLDPLEPRAAAWMLPRFIEPKTGRVLIDGEDIAWVTLDSLRAETVFVGGHDPFFTGTVLENITCGLPDYPLQAATEAAKLTHAHNYIRNLPQGYETMLGQRGVQPTPGQAFRLGLARAMLRSPALVIIEEPTQPLDNDTKSLLDDAYHRIVQDRTTIFLPSRLSTVRRCHRIVLMHQGRVEAIGSQETLVRSSALYRHWEYIRFNEFRHQPHGQSTVIGSR